MRRTATAFIFLFGLLMITAAYLSHSLVIIQRYAIVDSVVGDTRVYVHGKGDPFPLEVGKLVRVGDLICTGPNSSVELRWARWAGGMRVKIGPEARFVVKRATINRSSQDEESRLRIEKGTIWVRLRRALTGRSKFEVETPTVVAAVRGTVFSVAVGGDMCWVQVYEGRVELLGLKGRAPTLTTGSETTIAKGQDAVTVLPLAPESRAEWQEQTSVIGPFLEVTSPEDGIQMEGSTIAVVGRTEPGVEVIVNGQPIVVSEKGRFSADVSLGPGADTVAIVARDSADRETSCVRTLSRPVTSAEG